MNFLSTQWSTDGSTSSEPTGLCISSIVKTLTDNHTLDDRNHQGHHTTLLLSETLLSTTQASLCVGKFRFVTINTKRYVQVLGKFWTALGRRIGVVRVLQWLQQDGANPHSLHESLAWLQQRFPDRLISRRCDPQWSPHSPDLNPLDFYLWGYLKDRVYGNNPQTIPDLKAAIRVIPREECRRVIENFAHWIQMCLQHQGAYVEHIFWAPVKQRVFVVQTWNFGDVCYTGLTWCSWSYVSI